MGIAPPPAPRRSGGRERTPWRNGLLACLSATLLPAMPATAGTQPATVTAPLPAAAAEAPAAPTPDTARDFGFADQVGVSWVLVPVVVRTRSGGDGRLDARDFTLYVDGRPTPFPEFERRAEAPLSLLFMQDLSGSMESKLEASRQALGSFLDAARYGDEFAIASFAGGLTQVEVPFTEDLATLRESIGIWQPYGMTALHDAVAWIPDITLTGRNAKRAVILLTDGIDNASHLPPAEARELVRRAQIPVYVLGLASGSPYALDRQGTKVFRYADVLNLLATATGGHYYPVNGPEELKEACASIAEDLRLQYVLSFPTRAQGEIKDHPIKVVVDAPKARVIHRVSYRGRPPALPTSSAPRATRH